MTLVANAETPTATIAAAAEAAAALLPVQAPVDVRAAGAEAATALAGAATVAVRIKGAATGTVALLVIQEVADALTSVGGGGDTLTALEPSLRAAIDGIRSLGGEITAEACRLIDPTVTADLVNTAVESSAVTVHDADGRHVASLLLSYDIPARGEQRSVVTPFRPVAGTPMPDPHRLDVLRDVPMAVTVQLGSTRMTVRELLALTPGAIVELDRAAGSPVDVLVNGTLIARGEVVVVDEEYAVRITDIVAAANEAGGPE